MMRVIINNYACTYFKHVKTECMTLSQCKCQVFIIYVELSTEKYMIEYIYVNVCIYVIWYTNYITHIDSKVNYCV